MNMPPYLEEAVMAFVLVIARTSAMVMVAPMFGHAAVSPRCKAALSLVLAIAIFPTSGFGANVAVRTGAIVGIFGEVLIGAGIGFTTNLLLDGASLAGHIVGTQVGYSLVNIIDPQTRVDTPVFSVFHQLIVLLIFLQLDVHCWLVRGLARSFDYVPVGSALINPSVAFLWRSVGVVWFVGLQMAAPVLVATAIADLVLGFLAKASQQFPVMLVGMSVKALIGLLVLSTAMRYWPGLFERYFGLAISRSEQVFQLAR